MRHIGKLDKNKFRKITKDITTEIVILTEKQTEHIKERHPNNYEKFFKLFNDMIIRPDYIFKDDRPNTAILIKKFRNSNCFFMIIRLHTSQDNKEYKNSIITFFKIIEKKYNQYVRTKEIVWKG